jgi:hypothetical protein
MFCGHCGAAVDGAGPDPAAIVSPAATPAHPVQQAALARVRFTLPKPFFAKMGDYLPITFTNTIFVDGAEVRTLQMGETIDLEIPVGRHTIQLVHSYRKPTTLGMPISRRSNILELAAEPGTPVAVVAAYNYLTQKFNLELGSG